MDLQAIQAELCQLDTADRIERCRHLRQGFELGDERRGLLAHFEAFDLRTDDRPGEVLSLLDAEFVDSLPKAIQHILLVFRALAYYDLGHLHQVVQVCQEITESSDPEVISHRLALEVICAAQAGGGDPLQAFEGAIANLTALGDRYQQSTAWVRMEAAVVAKRLGRFEVARHHCEAVEYSQYKATASLILAEICMEQGDDASAIQLLVETQSALLDPLQLIRRSYVQAYAHLQAGRSGDAAAELAQAMTLLHDRGPGRRIERDVLDGITRLRASLVVGTKG